MRIIILLLAALVFIFAGCGKKEEESKPINFKVTKTDSHKETQEASNENYEYDPYAEAANLGDEPIDDGTKDSIDLDSLVDAQAARDMQDVSYDETDSDSEPDSAAIAQQTQIDSINEAREKELDDYKEKADFVNGTIKNMWDDAESNINFLNGSKTAAQVRAKANNLNIKAENIRAEAENYDSSDPRRQALENHAAFLEDVSTRMAATSGNSRKMKILQKDIMSSLREEAEKGDIIIGD